jgi:hypothetical protein
MFSGMGEAWIVDASVTAGNSSPLNDGAAALLIAVVLENPAAA